MCAFRMQAEGHCTALGCFQRAYRSCTSSPTSWCQSCKCQSTATPTLTSICMAKVLCCPAVSADSTSQKLHSWCMPSQQHVMKKGVLPHSRGTAQLNQQLIGFFVSSPWLQFQATCSAYVWSGPDAYTLAVKSLFFASRMLWVSWGTDLSTWLLLQGTLLL